jgi:hypothetical protein
MHNLNPNAGSCDGSEVARKDVRDNRTLGWKRAAAKAKAADSDGEHIVPGPRGGHDTCTGAMDRQRCHRIVVSIGGFGGRGGGGGERICGSTNNTRGDDNAVSSRCIIVKVVVLGRDDEDRYEEEQAENCSFCYSYLYLQVNII